MEEINNIDAATIRQLAALNGLDLAIERAADLVVPLQVLLAADEQIKALALGTVPTVGWPWGEADDEADQRR